MLPARLTGSDGPPIRWREGRAERLTCGVGPAARPAEAEDQEQGKENAAWPGGVTVHPRLPEPTQLV